MQSKEENEKLYLAAKAVVAAYESSDDVNNMLTRNYSYQDMDKCFSAGVNRGCYVASVLARNPIEEFDSKEVYMAKNFSKQSQAGG